MLARRTTCSIYRPGPGCPDRDMACAHHCSAGQHTMIGRAYFIFWLAKARVRRASLAAGGAASRGTANCIYLVVLALAGQNRLRGIS